ncbi:MAG: hypothetical protein ACF8XB_10745 [Planctomycetota bacterium JB042]
MDPGQNETESLEIAADAGAFEELRDEVAEIAHSALRNIVDEGDLRAFVQEMSSRAVRAAAAGREDLVEMVRGQVVAVAELHRIRANKAGWKVLDDVLGAVFRAFFMGIGARGGV